MILTKLDRHVNEMMLTAGKKFHNFSWSRFLIIVQNVNMVTNGKCNSRLNQRTSILFIEGLWLNSLGLAFIHFIAHSPSANRASLNCLFNDGQRIERWLADVVCLELQKPRTNVLFQCLSRAFL